MYSPDPLVDLVAPSGSLSSEVRHAVVRCPGADGLGRRLCGRVARRAEPIISLGDRVQRRVQAHRVVGSVAAVAEKHVLVVRLAVARADLASIVVKIGQRRDFAASKPGGEKSIANLKTGRMRII